MAIFNLLIPYISPLAREYGGVMLEQEPWDPNMGYLTKAGAVAYLNALLFGDPEEDLIENCGADVQSTVYAYPEPSNLQYSIAITHGVLGEAREEILEYAEVIQVQQETDINLQYPTTNVISAEWLTDAFNLDGDTLPTPDIIISGGSVAVESRVDGSLYVIYEVFRHIYSVAVPEREDAEENNYQSHIYAVWAGGNNVIEYDLPADLEDGGSCNNFVGSGVVFPPDEPEPPRAYPEDQQKYTDYCTGEEIEEPAGYWI